MKKTLCFMFAVIIIALSFSTVVFAYNPTYTNTYNWYLNRIENSLFFTTNNLGLDEIPNGSYVGQGLNQYNDIDYYVDTTDPFMPLAYGPSFDSTLSYLKSDFDGAAAGIRWQKTNSSGTVINYVAQNLVSYYIPVSLDVSEEYTSFTYNGIFTYYGFDGNWGTFGNVPYDVRFTEYFEQGIFKIYAVENIGSTINPKYSYTELIEGTDFTVGQLTEAAAGSLPLNPFSSYTGSNNVTPDQNGKYVDITFNYYTENNIDFFYVYFLSAFNGGSRYYVPRYQRLGVRAENIQTSEAPPDDDTVNVDLTEIKENLETLLVYQKAMIVPDAIQAGLVAEQKDRFDRVDSDLEDLAGSIGAEDFQKDYSDINYDDQFMNLYKVNFFNLSLGRFWNASVVKRLFFLMITFSLVSFVLFGRKG